MKPLKSQVSFNKERTFGLLRRNDSSLRKERDEDGGEEEEKKRRKGEKDRRWSRLRKGDTQQAKENNDTTDREAPPDRDLARKKERKSKDASLSIHLANSLAATLSPFSSFVSSHSPRGSRKGSPTPVGPSSPSTSADFDHSPSHLLQKENLSSSKDSTPRVQHSWGASAFSSCTASLLSYSPTSSPVVSSPSFSSTTSPSESPSTSEDELEGEATCPRIKVSSSDSVPPSSPSIPPIAAPFPLLRISPCIIEEDWEPFYSSEAAAKHRKTCQSCRCTRELHDVYHEDWVNVRERLGLGDSLGRTSREKCLQEGYSWVPPGLTSEQIYDYMSCLPGHKVPRLGTPGEKYRERQLMLQLPKQVNSDPFWENRDLALAFTRHVEPQYHTSFKDFVAARNDIALDIGITKHHIPNETECRGCGETLPKESVVVIAPRLGDNANYHPACFCCATCKEFLVDLVYCIWGDSLQCGRHYAEKLKPRCSACDEKEIRSGLNTLG